MKKFAHVLFTLLLLFFLASCTSTQESMYELAISIERTISGLQEASITTAGQKIAYLERQGSGDTIVLLHGFGANKDGWDRFVRYIPKEYRIIAFDLPGYGESFKDNEKTYSIDFIAKGFADAVDALKLDRFHIVGNSMGGWVGMLYTVQNPDRVITLGLFDTAGIASPEPSDLTMAIKKGQNILIPTTSDAFAELMKYGFYKEPFLPWPMRSVLARNAVADGPFKQKMFSDIHANYKDAITLLPDLRLPVLILWGADDRITHVSTVQVLERYLPNSTTVIMPDCGHMPMLERPKEAAQDYVAFIKAHLRPVSPE